MASTTALTVAPSDLEICRFLVKRMDKSINENPTAQINSSQVENMEKVTSTTPAVMLEYYLMPNGNGSEMNTVTTLSPTPEAEHHAEYEWFDIVIPIVCFIGILGNLLNLVVLTRRRMLSSMQRLERCATYGLAALALSDMLFCLAVVPHAFIDFKPRTQLSSMFIFSLYYRVYGIALINLFMMISNWLTVVIAINRFLVVMYPIHARNFISIRKTITSILVVVLCSTGISLPYFIHIKISPCVGNEGQLLYEHERSFPFMTKHLTIYMRWVFPIFSVFIPLALLAFCNACLIKELNSVKLFRKQSVRRPRSNGSSHKVTLTLVIIVLMLFLLVSPSEILKYINPYKSWGKIGYTIAHVTNVLQATNFALNFFLYCVVNPNFRKIITDTFLRCGHQNRRRKSMDDSMIVNGHESKYTARAKLLSDRGERRICRPNKILPNNNKHKSAKELLLEDCNTQITVL